MQTRPIPRKSRLAGRAAAGIAVAAGILVPPTASAHPLRVTRLTSASGPSLFAAGCPGAFHDEAKTTGLVIEPAVTVNPANPRNIVATWKQDVSDVFNARDDVVASSLDGGRTWRRTAIPGLTRCTGGSADTASDPWVSAGGDGTVYFGGQSGRVSSDPPPIAISASHSSDGGRHWATPATVSPPEGGNEQPAVTASRTLRGHAYMTWARFILNEPPWSNTLSFSRTTDGGATWSSPVPADDVGPFQIDEAPRIVVLPNGTLLDIFAQGDLETGRGTLQVARSLDEGRTWLPPVEAGSRPLAESPPVDPETGQLLPQPGYPSSAVAPDGTVYVAFEDSPSPDAGAIRVFRSRDGGLTWTQITVPGIPAFAFEPAIAVDGHGTAGVIWYDLRNDRPGDGRTTADVWFASSEDQGATWRQIHVAGPTDLRTAAPDVLNRVGEYQGMAGLPHGFAAVFTLASPQAYNGPTDIFFAGIGPGVGPEHGRGHVRHPGGQG